MADVNYIVKLKDLVSPTLQKLINKSNELSNSVEQVSKKGSMIGDFVKGSLITQGLGMVTSSISGVIEKTIDATAEYQKFQAVLSTTLGSDAMANESMKMIQAFADVTNFSSTELTDSFIKLANRNVVLKTEELTNMADVANATGKSFEQLTEAILDINNSERWKEIGIKSKVAGDKVQLSWKGITKEVENTELGVKNAILEFGKMDGVAGMTDKVGQTVGGKISSLQDTWKGIFLDIGKSTSSSILSVVQSLTDLINTFRSSNAISKGFEKILEIVKIIKLNFNGFVDVIQPVIDLFLEVGAGIKENFDYMIESVGGFAGIIDKFETIINVLKLAFTILKPILSVVWNIIKWVGKLLIDIGSLVVDIINKIAKVILKFAELLGFEITKIKGFETKGTGEGYKGFGTEMGAGFAKEIAPAFLDKPKEGTKAWYEASKKEKETKAQTEKPKTVKELGVKGSSVGRETKIVNINIGSLVKDMNITVSDLKTGMQNIKEEVAKALIGAVNDTKTI